MKKTFLLIQSQLSSVNNSVHYYLKYSLVLMLIQRVEEMFPAFKLWMSNSPQYFPLEECDILLKLEVKKNDENFWSAVSSSHTWRL